MINFKIINKILGSLLFLEALLMIVCLGMAFVFGEDDILPFMVSIVVTVFFGFLFKYHGRNAENRLSRRDSFVVVTLSWLFFSLFGTMPFLFGGYIPSFTDAFFESVSGFTSTGSSIINDVEALPHGILFWRSLSQWLGGLGIVFFTIAILPSVVGGSTRVCAAEATGPMQNKLHPRLSMCAKWLWLVYVFITASCCACYMLFGMDWFHGINYAMTTAATGGFVIDNKCIFENSPALEYTATFFCFISGVNFTLLYFSVSKLKLRNLWKSSEFKFYTFFVLSCAAIVMAELMAWNGYDFEFAFRSSIFQVVSLITTTGYSNDDVVRWHHLTWLVLWVGMAVGACGGSTTGGMKCARVVMLLKIIKNEMRQRLHPNAVLPLKIDGQNVDNSHRVSLLAFTTSYLLLLLLSVAILMADNIDVENSISIAIASLANAGPSLMFSTTNHIAWSDLPDLSKWVASALMLIGRLEIFSILMILTPQFWREN